MKKSICLIMACFSIPFLVRVSMASETELHHLTRGHKPIKVFLKDFVNESGRDQIAAENFKKSLENALFHRKAVKFVVTKSADASDVQISGTIKKYQYLERGPIKNYMGASGLLLDMAASATQNYVEMEVEFAIAETKTGKVIWKDSINAFIKKVMTPEESLPLIYDKVSRAFLSKAFGKRR